MPFPELAGLTIRRDVVVDGEVVAWTPAVANFELLQHRIGRSAPSEALLRKCP
ncbi:hypothetical protein HBB16_04265 [Pseudonocardia sp. MCCB 268]|nr:hypothetical protein [Pseudonocardia cytotoxica]